MLDFITIKLRNNRGVGVLYPEFIVKRAKDLMVRGGSFYAVWDQHTGFWSTDEMDVQKLIDNSLDEYVAQNKMLENCEKLRMTDYSSNLWNKWQSYVKSLPDNYCELDSNIAFSNSVIRKEDYISKTLPYELNEIETPAYEELISTLYDKEERNKIEWSIGSIISGHSKELQKFIVLYGAPGSGKSTILNIIQKMFKGYWGTFDSSALTKSNDSFALEAFHSNPLVAIEHDGDLSKIETNTRLNSIVSHEMMSVNEKFKSKYSTRFHCFLYIGTNKPVRITDAKSGILRRLIDVQPSGRKFSKERYLKLMRMIDYELGGIAAHCLKRFEEMGTTYYDDYIPISMLAATNDIFNFLEENYDFFVQNSEEGISLTTAWRRYQEFCEDSKVPYPLSRRLFRDELENYFKEFKLRADNNRRSVFYGFKSEKLNYVPLEGMDQKEKPEEVDKTDIPSWLNLSIQDSILDEILTDCPAQYAGGENETPLSKWDNCKTTLKDLNTTKLHYVRPPENLVVIDFDLKNEKGEKDYALNLRAASRYPETYAEVSKGGSGIHLHYWYQGDVRQLSRVSKESTDIEIKVFTGNSSLRRKLSKCNNKPLAAITSGLPLRERKPMIKEEVIKNEKGLRIMIKKNLQKEIHAFTKPSIDFIQKILDDAYASGMKYDVRDLRPAIQNFAMNSHHNADYCLRCVSNMKFASEEASEDSSGYEKDAPIVFFDVEVFPDLFVVVWKILGDDKKKITWYNPTAEEIESLFKYRLVGFNNRNYDNHILYTRAMGYTELQLYHLSKRIIANDTSAKFHEAYNISYTDIYDFLSPQNKMSLKKWEIKLGIHHQELGLPWDKPVDKALWPKVGEYCGYDVDATEAVWLSPEGQADFKVREILADWADMTVNTPTNTLSMKIVFGNDPHPQNQFIYTDLSTIFPGYRFDPYGIPREEYAPGVKVIQGKSIYRGEDPSEGGKVNAKPGMYFHVGVLDITSQHPHSIKRLNVFGDKYTTRFVNMVDARKYIKYGEIDKAKEVLPEKVHKYLDDPKQTKALAGGLKGAINPVYGLTSASFDNKFRDPRNKDNIVAKYGALFMINLRHEIEDRGWEWIHIKTDSIKIANITPEIVEFVKDYGRQYGFEFEFEHVYEKMCLVNESTFIALVSEEDGKKVDPYWTATGTQFQVPYVFKVLFSKEPILFDDLCETKSVNTAMYLDFNEKKDPEGLGFVGEEFHDRQFIGKVGRFCPMKDGCGAGILLRQDAKDPEKFASVVGTKKPGKGGFYRWMESEMVMKLGLQDKIDRSYYDRLVNEAVDDISKYGDFERFVSMDLTPDWMKIPPGEDEELPFDEVMNPPIVS